MVNYDNKYMNIAIKEAKKALELNEIPVGAIIVCDNKIISKGYNLRDSSQVVTKHAEIIAIERANKKLKNWRLVDCTLYTTLKPCSMCTEIIKASKIKNVVYAADSNIVCNQNDINVIQIEDEDIIKISEQLIKEAFKNIREK